jgi:cytidylate kinase
MKKKLFIMTMLLGMFTYSNAQSMGDLTKAASSSASQATTTAANSFDVAGISNQVMGVLSPKLKLTDAQKPAVNSLVNEMLNKKKSILPTAISDKVSYASKMTAIRDLFPTKMKKIVNPEQYTTLLGLLPKSASSPSVLTKMLF